MPSVGDIIRVTLLSGYGGQDFYNIYHWRLNTIQDATNLFAGFKTSMEKYWLTPSRSLFSSAFSWKQMKVENISEANYPFFVYPLSITGTAAGEVAPTFLSFQYKQEVGTRKTRAGFKRYGGVVEGVFNGNTWSGSFVTAARVFEAFHGTELTIEYPSNTVIATAYPVVLKDYTTEFPTPADHQDVLFGNFIDRPTTQNSRKVRGV